MGGIVKSQQAEVDEDPLFRVGERAILFLHQFSPGHFHVEGGPSGRFVIRNSMVSPINDEGVKISNPVPEADFIAQIQKA